jgi:hypothetical protein
MLSLDWAAGSLADLFSTNNCLAVNITAAKQVRLKADLIDPVSAVHRAPTAECESAPKWDPGLIEDQPVDLVRELGRQPGSRSAPIRTHQERISSCDINALESSELGSHFGASSQSFQKESLQSSRGDATSNRLGTGMIRVAIVPCLKMRNSRMALDAPGDRWSNNRFPSEKND